MVKTTVRTLHHDLDKYLDLVHEGEQVVITKRGKPWATITPTLQPTKPTKPKKPKKLDWNKVFARTDEIFKGRTVEAVKTLLELRDKERW